MQSARIIPCSYKEGTQYKEGTRGGGKGHTSQQASYPCLGLAPTTKRDTGLVLRQQRGLTRGRCKTEHVQVLDGEVQVVAALLQGALQVLQGQAHDWVEAWSRNPSSAPTLQHLRMSNCTPPDWTQLLTSAFIAGKRDRSRESLSWFPCDGLGQLPASASAWTAAPWK